MKYGLHPDFDVQIQLEELLTQLKVTWPMKHVKGHQQGQDTPWEAKINNLTDQLATQTRNSLTTAAKKIQPPLYCASHIMLTINNKVITRQHEKDIQHAFTNTKMKKI
eukprot:7734777-Ditylum_brightwellii.AAC.1